MPRVLIVDDKEENLYYLGALLGASGFTVDQAHHGAEALVRARRQPPDVVVSDLLMPIMDGYTLLRHWKADTRLRTVPFIVYTATYTEAQDEQLALDLGADAFILKPSEPQDFLERIRAVLARPQAPSAPAALMPQAPPSGSDQELLRTYNETLVRKLEEKSLQLQEANRSLQQDIAERKLAEASLRESEQRFRQIAENINEVFWITDVSKRQMIYVSPAYEKIWARSCESLMSEPGAWLASIHPDDRERVMQAALTRQTSGDYDETYRVLRPDGSVRWIRDRAFPVMNERAEVYRLVGTALDITEQKALEEQLSQARRLESIGQLTGGVAHDFNNLLTVILSNAELLGEQLAGDPRLAPMVNMMMVAAERGAELTRQLLAFARKQALQPRSIDLNTQVTALQPLLQRALGEHIQISFELEREPWHALVDPAQLDNALLNLCLNARDAMPMGGRLVIETGNRVLDESHVEQLGDVRPGRYVMLAVRDSGGGIPPEIIGRVFEPFFTTKEKGKGTGLGLAMVYGFVKQSGGHVAVESMPGVGTTMRLYFPRAGAAAPMPADAVLPRAAGGHETVLLVEDDDLVRGHAHGQLVTLGYKVVAAENGARALDILRAGLATDLLFTDVVMPGMSGRELADQALALRPGLAVLFTSGYAEDAIVHHGRLDEGVHFLPKPYRREDLARKVREALDTTK